MEYIAEQKNKSIFKTYLIYFIALACFVCVRILSSLGVFIDLSNNAIDIIYSSIIEIGCLFLLPLCLYCLWLKQKPKQVFKTCNFAKMNFRSVVYSILLGFFIYFFTLLLSTFFNGIITMFGYRSSSSVSEEITLTTYLIQIVTTAILPAFCEEFLHRGIVLQGTKHMSIKKAIIISSVLFGLIHLNITQVFYAIILGLIMGYTSVVAKNIWPAIIVHFMNNFMSVTNGYLMSASKEYASIVNSIYQWFGGINLILVILLIMIATIILVFIIYLLINRIYFNSKVKKVEDAIKHAYSNSYVIKTGDPISINTADEKDMIESTTKLNVDFNTAQGPIEIMMPKQKDIYKTTYKDNLFCKASLFLGVIITIFTFIWGTM